MATKTGTAAASGETKKRGRPAGAAKSGNAASQQGRINLSLNQGRAFQALGRKLSNLTEQWQAFGKSLGMGETAMAGGGQATTKLTSAEPVKAAGKRNKAA